MRKNHNKLYYSRFEFKTIFKVPGSLMFYPTTDEHLIKLKKNYSDASDINHLADFIIQNRNMIKFRFQDRKAIFYSNKALAQKLIDRFWDFWIGTTEVNNKAVALNKNEVICKRFPHGTYQYQVHLKKDTHRYINNTERSALWNFLQQNNDTHISHRYVHDYLSGKTDYCYSGYFYVKEEKVLTLLYMLAQKGINKVIKFVKEE